MTIERVKCRARIELGTLTVVTPYVQSFNVRKQRGQVSTFDASLKVSHDEISGTLTGNNVQIYAGEGSASELIFTGIVRNAKISPCYDDPKYVLLSVSGADPLSLLAGKKYTRRCRSTLSSWTAITGVVRSGLKSGKFTYQNESRFDIDSGEANNVSKNTMYAGNVNPADTNKVATAPNVKNTAKVPLKIEIQNTYEESVL
jgi:hypothetical protein